MLVSSSFAVRGLGVVCGFAMHVILSRTLGAEGAGLFYLGLTVMMAGAAIGKFGLDTALMRFGGSAYKLGNLSEVRGLYRQACLIALFMALAVTALLLPASAWLSDTVFGNSELRPVMMWLALAIAPFSLIWIQSGVLKAVDRAVAATWVESAMLPLLMALFAIALAYLGLLTPERAAISYLAVTALVCLAGSWIFQRGAGAQGPRHLRSWRHLLSAAFPLALIDGMNFLMAWAIIPILGSVAAETEVGVYNAAHRLTMQLSIVLVVFGGIMAPRFAALYDKGDRAGLEALAARTTALMSAVALPAGIVFFAWPGMVAFIFGEEFAAGGQILQVLALGQLFNLLSGPAGYVLVMSGHQRSMRNILLFTLLITLPLIAMLAKSHGGVGAAWAVSGGLVLQNSLALWAVYRRLGIIGLPGLRRLRTQLKQDIA